tara:strand:+ start:1398 stop:1607 length:210 start_codon:yes stop_codon:yes gene_type:complete
MDTNNKMSYIKKMFSDIFMCSCIEKKLVKKDEDDLSSDEEYRDTYVKYTNNNVSFDEEYNETFYYESHV